MTLICEECGKIYHIDPEKLRSKLKGDVAKTKCHVCGHVIVISQKAIDAADSGGFADGELQVHYSSDSSSKTKGKRQQSKEFTRKIFHIYYQE